MSERRRSILTGNQLKVNKGKQTDKPELQRLTNMVNEVRDYKLNKDKALKKKLERTNGDFTVSETGGGLSIKMNTALYELFKYASDIFFTSEEIECSVKRIPVHDERGSLVETKYKLSTGRMSIYTANLYHTMCSCLVNGKQSRRFIDDDLHKIISIVGSSISESGLTVSELNASIKQNLVNVLNKRSMENDESGDDISAYHDTIQSVQFEPTTEDELTTDTIPKVIDITDQGPSNTHKIDQVERVDDADDIKQGNYCNLLKVVEEIKVIVDDLNDKVERHIQNTTNMFSQVRDEMTSIKRQMQCNDRHLNDHIDGVNAVAVDVKDAVSATNDSLVRRLQALSDTVKTISLHLDQEKPGSSSQTQNKARRRVNIDDNIGIQPVREVPTVVDEVEIQPREYTPNRTLLIGDSILKGVQKRGLHDMVEICRSGGARIQDVMDKVRELDMTQYKNVVVYVGGNDASSGQPIPTIRTSLQRLVHILQQHQCHIYLCTACPRRDVDVTAYNSMVHQIQEETGVYCIDCYTPFVYGDGRPAGHYYVRDGIHLSVSGSKTLVYTINKTLGIIKQRRQRTQQPEPTSPETYRGSPYNARRSQNRNRFVTDNYPEVQPGRRQRTWDDGQENLRQWSNTSERQLAAGRYPHYNRH